MDNSKDTDDLLIIDDSADDTITLIGSTSLDHNYGAVPPELLTTLDSISLTSPVTYAASNTFTLNTPNTVWTTTGTGTSGVDWSIGKNQSASISLKGEDADIDINGKSMKSWMEQVEQRLNILTVNPELEDEWTELKELGDRYRELEKRCKEKADVWTKLKSMPPPLDL